MDFEGIVKYLEDELEPRLIRREMKKLKLNPTPDFLNEVKKNLTNDRKKLINEEFKTLETPSKDYIDGYVQFRTKEYQVAIESAIFFANDPELLSFTNGDLIITLTEDKNKIRINEKICDEMSFFEQLDFLIEQITIELPAKIKIDVEHPWIKKCLKETLIDLVGQSVEII